MRNGPVLPGGAKLIGGVAVAATVLVGILMRLVDPLSTVVIPAEDPYTHMALIREHVLDGTLAPMNDPGELYPPGMHAFLTAVWAFTGTELYHIFRLGPALLGGIGILGMGLLLWRHGGPVAGFVGALGYAVAPEIIFRTTMMSPTALDLALLPFFLFVLLELAAGRMRWLGVAVPFVIFLTFAHPWLLGLLAGTAIVWVLISFLFPWPASRSSPASPTGMASVLAVVGGGIGLAITGCGGYCGPGLSGFLPDLLSSPLAGLTVMVGAMVPVALLETLGQGWKPWLRQETQRPRSVWGKALASLVLGAVFAAVTWFAVNQGMPSQVDLPRMLGWPILGLALFAFVALPFLSSRAAFLGAAFASVTYPLVVINVFNSPFWPHRTAVFLGVGAVILLGLGTAALERWGTWALRRAKRVIPTEQHRRYTSALLVVPALLVAFSTGGAVYAGTPDGYSGGWYRLYEPCEFEAFQEAQEQIAKEDSAVVVTGSWQPRLVLGAFHEEPSHVWADPNFFWSEQHREDAMANRASDGDTLFVLTDRQMHKEHPDLETGFLEGEAWMQVDSWCPMMGSPDASMVLYKMEAPPV